QNRVDNGVGSLGGFERLLQRFFASVVHAIRKHDERLPPVLGLHHFVRGKVDRVVQQCPAAMTAAATTTTVTASSAATARPAASSTRPGSSSTLPTARSATANQLGLFWGLQFPQSRFQFFTRGGQILQQLNLSVKVDDESGVLGLQHLVEEAVTG